MTLTTDKPMTMSVMEAAKILGIRSRDAAYQAARNGDIPTIRIGRLYRVPIVALERMLEQTAAGRSEVL